MARVKSWFPEAPVRTDRRSIVALLGAALFTVCAPVLPAAATTALDGYLEGLKSWSAAFTQTVVDARGKQVNTGRGRLLVVRPGRFRWESAPQGAGEAAQLLVADGRNLWFYDRDLDQVTVKPQAEALPQSPAMLLAGGSELRSSFKVSAAGRRDGLDWVLAQPLDSASDFREARFGFARTELQRLVVVDKLGQQSTLVFSGVKRNAPVDAALVTFSPPADADLIGKPLKP